MPVKVLVTANAAALEISSVPKLTCPATAPTMLVIKMLVVVS